MTKTLDDRALARARAMDDRALATGIAAASQTLRCRRTQGAFLDRQVAKGDMTWTYARVASTTRKFLAAMCAVRDARSLDRATTTYAA